MVLKMRISNLQLILKAAQMDFSFLDRGNSDFRLTDKRWIYFFFNLESYFEIICLVRKKNCPSKFDLITKFL